MKDFLAERSGAREVWRALFARRIPEAPRALAWAHTLGSASLAVFTVQIVTGCLLALNYVATPDHAYDSLRHLDARVFLGAFVRSLHKWGASFFVVLVSLHLMRVYLTGSYKAPRELTWLTGVALFVLAMVFSFTGYLLPWDQKAYWATAVGTEMAAQVPLVGGALGKILKGGEELGAATLARFYAAHTLWIPFATFALVGLHLFQVVWHGIADPPDRLPPELADDAARAEAARRYALRKAAGEPFFPGPIFRDAVAATIVLVLLCAFALRFGAPLEALADPADSEYNPRPEWYFLFLFEALKIFPGWLESLAAAGLPALAILALALVPFLDRRPDRRPAARPVWIGIALVSLAGILFLTIRGARAPLVNPAGERDPAIATGRRLYGQMNCGYCHRIGDAGGRIGPPLDRSGLVRGREWLARHFRDPQALSPGSAMPKLNLMDDEIAALAAFLIAQATSGGHESARSLFADNCSACHRLQGDGGDGGPDLTGIGAKRDVEALRRYIVDPSSADPSSTMPGFRDSLTPEQIEDLARYLSSSR